MYVYKNGCLCVYMCVCPGITLERLERFYVCFIYIPRGGWCGRQRIWMTPIVKEIKLLLLLGNRLKHIRGNFSYLVT
jgi:hypothetical protein